MKKVLIIALISFFCFAITSCSLLDKSADEIRHPSAISIVNETDITDSPVPLIPTQQSNPLNKDDMDAINYNQYLNKVWVVKNPAMDLNFYPSFCISKVEGGEIRGYFNLVLIVPNNIVISGEFAGTIANNIAECSFDNGFGLTGTLKMVFQSNDEIEARVEYSDKEKALMDDATYQYIPLTINQLKSLEGFEPIESQSFTLELNQWGTVKFVTGKITWDENEVEIYFYLTDMNDNIIYNFHMSYLTNVYVEAVSFQDVNKDSLLDLIIIVHDVPRPAGPGIYKAAVFFQDAEGSFKDDDRLNQEINDTGNNTNVKTIIDFLSKKFNNYKSGERLFYD